jgi:hypothetical protein
VEEFDSKEQVIILRRKEELGSWQPRKFTPNRIKW